MKISVLGSLAVERDGVPVELGPQLRRVLAALVVRQGAVVSIDRLVDAVWMGEPPEGADGSVKTYVTRLRRALDPHREGLITYRQPGYVLSLNGHHLDSTEFEAEVDGAARLLRTCDDEAAIGVLGNALARWHGDAYAGYADEDWARPEAVRLEERRREAADLLLEARLGIGDVERAVAEAQAAVETDPLRERPRELLMRALFASGRQADALRAYADFRSLLAEETGLDPSPELAELEGRIARGDTSLRGHVRALRGYELGERIGEGAYAVVHRAVQPGIERDVAVKIIRSELADRPEFVRRFEHEAQIVAAVEHPHVVPMYDFWREPGAAYLVMRLLRGGSVEDALRKRGPFSRKAAADLLRDVGGALEAAHRAGVVHRDVRPANLLLDDQGDVYLADFGIALPASTIDDQVVASPAYAAPEMLRGEPAGVAADVLSLGVTTFELLTGRLPFADSDSRAELIRRQLEEPLPSVRATRTDLPAGIDDVLARATAKAPDDRHATIAALVDDLVELLSETAPQPNRTQGRSSGPVTNPYVGLHAFEETDADRFHGRNVVTTELVEALSQHPFVVAVGPSGSGKSSVVRAGLVPALRRGAIAGSDQWFITTMVPGSDPIDALETALLRIAVNPPASLRDQLAEPGGLLRAVRRVLPDDRGRVLVVIDQLEELFTMTDAAEQETFLTELAAAIAAPNSPLRVVATLRADHYDAPLRHHGFADLVTEGTVTIRPMTASELERVIVQPAAAVGVTVEPALVAELVVDASERPGALPLLQFALTEAFERRVSDVMLASVHHQLGGLTGALAASADRIVDVGGEADEAETRRIFGRLVTLGDGVEDTRRRARRSEFGDGERTAWLLDALASARLLTFGRDTATREPTVEVAHEALLRDWPRLRGWLNEDRDDLRTLRGVSGAAAVWRGSGRDASELARGGRLEMVSDLANRRPELLNEDEAEWVDASRSADVARIEAEAAAAAHDKRQNRRLRRLLAAAAVLLVVAVTAAAVAAVLRSRALDSEKQAVAAELQARTAEDVAVAARQDAEIERLSALSTAQLTAAPDVAILLALEANRRRDDPATQTALQRAIASQPTVVGFFPNPLEETAFTRFNRDGSLGVAWTVSRDDGQLEFLDPATGEQVSTTYTSDIGIRGATMSGDGSVAAIAHSDGVIRFVGLDGEESAPPHELGDAANLVKSLALDDDGRRLLITSEASIRVVEVATGEVVSVYEPSDPAVQPVNGLIGELSSDGSYYVVEYVLYPAIDPDAAVQPAQVTVAAGYDVVDATTGERLERVEADEVTSLDLSLTDRLVIGHLDGSIEVRDLDDDAPSFRLTGLSGMISAVGSGRDGAIAAASVDGTMRHWSPDGSSVSPPISLGGVPFDLAFDADGAINVSLEAAGLVRVDPRSSTMVDEIRRRPNTANVFAAHGYYERLSADGSLAQYARLDDDEVVMQIPVRLAFPYGIGADVFYSSDGAWSLLVPLDLDDPFLVNPVPGDAEDPTGLRREVDVAGALAAAGTAPLDVDTNISLRPAPGGEQLILIHETVLGGVEAVWIDVATSTVTAGPVALESFGQPLVLADGRVVLSFGTSTIRVLSADLDGPGLVVDGTEGFRAFDIDDVTGLVLIGAADGRVGLLDADTATVRLLEDADGTITAGAFSQDGATVAVFSPTDGLQLLDVTSGRRIGLPMPVPGGVEVNARHITWAEDDTGVWLTTAVGPVRFAAHPARWRAIACGIVHRELTPDEWRTLVSDSEPQVAACG